MPLILVVDDDVGVLSVTVELIRSMGYDVEGTASSSIAERTLRSAKKIDLLFSDIRLGPGLDGIGLARIATERHIPVILITGYSSAILELDEEYPWTVVQKPLPAWKMRVIIREKLRSC